jgi:ribonuclease P protein component
MGTFTFGKEERLKKEIWIRELFKRGSSFHLHPFRVLFLIHPDAQASVNQIMISVPVRLFKRAVDRNTIKRRIREGYRLNKEKIPHSGKWLIAYIYTAKNIVPSDTIHRQIALTMERFRSYEGKK